MFLNFKRFKKNSGALITTLERNHKNTKTTFIGEHHSPRKYRKKGSRLGLHISAGF